MQLDNFKIDQLFSINQFLVLGGKKLVELLAFATVICHHP